MAGDSGVFEAASPAKQPTSQHHRLTSIPNSVSGVGLPSTGDAINSAQMADGNGSGPNIRETAQVLIRLKYSLADSLLYVGVEKARNLQALLINVYPAADSSRKM